ncbi:MAG: nicotinamide-nucleotide amidohydrolase family protein, partial [Oscillospiraceae bacterium]|nr:nicotinamide-nucleotide amidohydrolase family protein [Oscillospiraceae bacterium]
MLICPKCKEKLNIEGRTYTCVNRHCYDTAKSGYVNLLLANQMNSALPGDNKLMVQARKAFLDKGYYAPLAEALCRSVSEYAFDGCKILDAGCGEGYYTEKIAAACPDAEIVGIDISKNAADYAARRTKAVKFAVGSVFHLPVADCGCDMLTTLFAPYCGEGEVRLRLTARGTTEEECRALCASVAEQIRAESCEPYKPGTMNDYIFGLDCDSLQEAFVKRMREKHLTVSAAESCTGGYVAKRITDISGASEVLSGSFVTYSEETKMAMVGVRAETLQKYSVYSAEIAVEMAQGCRLAVGADIGIGITGVAGTSDAAVMRDGEEITVAAGTVYVACADADTVCVERLELPPGRRVSAEAREFVRRRASSHALFMALRM